MPVLVRETTEELARWSSLRSTRAKSSLLASWRKPRKKGRKKERIHKGGNSFHGISSKASSTSSCSVARETGCELHRHPMEKEKKTSHLTRPLLFLYPKATSVLIQELHDKYMACSRAMLPLLSRSAVSVRPNPLSLFHSFSPQWVTERLFIMRVR